MNLINALILLAALTSDIDDIQRCSNPYGLLEIAGEVEKTHRDVVIENGVKVDRRSEMLRAFEDNCLKKFFENDIKMEDDRDSHILFSAVKKSHFYTRTHSTINQYEDYLDRTGNFYKPSREYIDGVRQFLPNKDGVKGELLLNHELELFEPNKDNTLIIVSSPYCTPSKRLKDWLEEENIEFKSVSLIWAFKPPPIFDLADFYQDTDNQGYDIVVGVEDWKTIKFWGTPTIYYYKDGDLEKQVGAWSEESKEFLRSLSLASN
ncbi:hypothetical protein WG68_12305 [Arsukibacterium ikkense]|uniref:Thioredoxin domain-containing protein n=1 Tax=Arsukibacterium ikkense TaxID=336831 RepID=A0A0M2V7S3_9GAMM|nr:hypothetical protein [Arsukibacterium ikkense]KKO45198.1 hypothetical protein WG68_12305 [Arsukibacterium ikkense]